MLESTPGNFPWEALSEAQQNYYLEWRRQFLQKLCENPEGIAEQRLAAKVYFDEQVNLIGTPKEVADEKKVMASLLEAPHHAFAEFIEAEDMQISQCWEIKDRSNASGKILEAGYADKISRSKHQSGTAESRHLLCLGQISSFHKYFNIFDLSFSDSEGNILAKLNYGQPKTVCPERNNHFTWECWQNCRQENCLLLRKNVDKEPYTFRRVDKFLSLTPRLSILNLLRRLFRQAAHCSAEL